MYIRRISRKNKDGSVVRYLQLAHNVWDPKARCAKAKVLYPLGREDNLDRQALKRLSDSLAEIVGHADTSAAPPALPEEDSRFLGSKGLGHAWVLARLWHTLQFDQAVASLAREIPFFSALEQTLFALVSEYVHPTGIPTLASADRESSETPLRGLPLSQVTRTLSFLNTMGTALQQEIVRRASPVLGMTTDPLFVGSIRPQTLHSEAESSKRSQTEIRVVVSGRGFPVHCWLQTRETSESVDEQARAMSALPHPNRVVSIDRDDHPDLGLLSHPGRYRKVLPYIDAKEIATSETSRQERRILVRNHLLKEQRNLTRRQILAELEDQIAAAESMPPDQRSVLLESLRTDPVYSPYVWESGKTLRIRWRQALYEGRRDGKFVLSTQERTLSTGALVQGYTGLQETLGTLDALARLTTIHRFTHRPHQYNEAHVNLCWIALFLIRYVEVQSQQMWHLVDRELGSLQLGVFNGPAGRVYRRTAMTPEQSTLFARLGVPEPPQIFDPNSRETPSALLGAILYPWIDQRL